MTEVFDKTDLKELILQTSKDILIQEGKEGLSIRKIAGRISYSPATIYLYYKDKDAIMHDLMRKGFDRLESYLEVAYDDENLEEKMRKMGRAYVKFAIENKDWYDLMFNSSSPMKHMEKSKEEWDKGAQMFDIMTQACQSYINKYAVKKMNANILALQLWCSVHGLIHLWQTDRLKIVEVDDYNSLLETTLDSIHNSLFIHV
jgi:AcrR family transcriptional regulator